MSARFADRTDAGRQLAAALVERGIEADLVLALPRGGLPLGRAVADALSTPLDVALATKIGAPGNPEYAIGAVATDGSVWRNESAITALSVNETDFETRCREALVTAREKAERYRASGHESDLAGKRVLLVDDGVATGSTAQAGLEMLRVADPARLVFVVPVGPPDAIAALEALVDEVICLATPGSFRGVAQFYDEFDQVSDTEAMAYLDG